MNKIYRLKFDKSSQQFIAVSEITKGCSKSSTRTSGKNSAAHFNLFNLTAIGSLVVSLFASQPVWANGLQGMEVISGKASMEINGVTTTIKNSPDAIINWKQFNIDKGNTVQFLQESAKSAVFNKVTSNQLSQINGTLKSNGQVFLINPNGILFGKDAVVDTAGFLASTLNLSNEDIKKGKLNLEQEKSKAIADIINNGVITVSKNGSVALVGGNVKNNGKIKVENGNVLLAAGQKITISDLSNPNITYSLSAPKNKVLNLGEVFAKNGKVNLSGGKVVHKGKIQANSDNKSNTTAVELSAKTGDVVVDGKISANGVYKGGVLKITGKTVTLEQNAEIDLTGNHKGGTAYIGGDEKGKGNIQLAEKTEIKKGAKVDVSAKKTGNGGKAIVWGNHAEVAGTIKAKGGEISGDGGFIETSGKTIDIAEDVVLDASAKNGKGGEWLLDPEDLTIDDTLATTITSQLNQGTDVTQEAERNLTLNFTNPIELSSGKNASLSLKAGKNIVFNAKMFNGVDEATGLLKEDSNGKIISSNGLLKLYLTAGNRISNAKFSFIPLETRNTGSIDLYWKELGYQNETSEGDFNKFNAISYNKGNIYLATPVSTTLLDGDITYTDKDVKLDTISNLYLSAYKGSITISAPDSNLNNIKVGGKKNININANNINGFGLSELNEPTSIILSSNNDMIINSISRDFDAESHANTNTELSAKGKIFVGKYNLNGNFKAKAGESLRLEDLYISDGKDVELSADNIYAKARLLNLRGALKAKGENIYLGFIGNETVDPAIKDYTIEEKNNLDLKAYIAGDIALLANNNLYLDNYSDSSVNISTHGNVVIKGGIDYFNALVPFREINNSENKSLINLYSDQTIFLTPENRAIDEGEITLKPEEVYALKLKGDTYQSAKIEVREQPTLQFMAGDNICIQERCSNVDWDTKNVVYTSIVDAPLQSFTEVTEPTVSFPDVKVFEGEDEIVEPTEPAVEPKEPTETGPTVEPSNPTETEPTVEPSNPTETEPTVEPSDPTETEPTVEPSDPTETEPTVEPSVPTETEPTVEPSNPTETEPTVEPSVPTETEPTVEPSEPTETQPEEKPNVTDPRLLEKSRVFKKEEGWYVWFENGYRHAIIILEVGAGPHGPVKSMFELKMAIQNEKKALAELEELEALEAKKKWKKS